MSTLLLHIRTAWSDYFSVTNPTNYNSQTYTSRQNPSSTSLYISNCLFNSITSTSSGGGLYCTSVTYLLVESTSFFSCKASGSGGAIYFSNSGGQCVLHGVCGYDCTTTYASGSDGQFAYIRVNNGVSSKNYVNYSSITRCVNEISNSYRTLDIYNGKIFYPSVNLSMNKCCGRTGIICNPFSDSNSVICSLSYCSFADNIATMYTCIVIETTGAKYEIKCCNILRNTQVSSSGGTISTSGNLMIEGCCILENVATYIFYQSSSYTITLSNCTVDKTTNNGYLTTQNTVTKSFVLALNHISTRNCHSNYDSVGTLIPIIQTPSSSKKQKLYYTCERDFSQSRLRDFISLLGVFIINFIHVDIYNYPLY